MVRHDECHTPKLSENNYRVALGAIGFPYVVSSTALGRSGAVAASERITVGCVGTGPQGTYDMRNFLAQKDCRVIAICDLKAPVREATQKLVNDHYKNQDCATLHGLSRADRPQGYRRGL